MCASTRHFFCCLFLANCQLRALAVLPPTPPHPRSAKSEAESEKKRKLPQKRTAPSLPSPHPSSPQAAAFLLAAGRPLPAALLNKGPLQLLPPPPPSPPGRHDGAAAGRHPQPLGTVTARGAPCACALEGGQRPRAWAGAVGFRCAAARGGTPRGSLSLPSPRGPLVRLLCPLEPGFVRPGGLRAGRGSGAHPGALRSSVSEQARLKGGVVREDTEEWQKEPSFAGLERVGGVDLSYIKGDDSRACASLVVLSYPGLEVTASNRLRSAGGCPGLPVVGVFSREVCTKSRSLPCLCAPRGLGELLCVPHEASRHAFCEKKIERNN
ncbi:putative endonuclease FLJ39025 [Aix galericulata]|nr:putative endonuclease FLJ39025 [Aix galericulata]